MRSHFAAAAYSDAHSDVHSHSDPSRSQCYRSAEWHAPAQTSPSVKKNTYRRGKKKSIPVKRFQRESAQLSRTDRILARKKIKNKRGYSMGKEQP